MIRARGELCVSICENVLNGNFTLSQHEYGLQPDKHTNSQS